MKTHLDLPRTPGGASLNNLENPNSQSSKPPKEQVSSEKTSRIARLYLFKEAVVRFFKSSLGRISVWATSIPTSITKVFHAIIHAEKIKREKLVDEAKEQINLFEKLSPQIQKILDLPPGEFTQEKSTEVGALIEQLNRVPSLLQELRPLAAADTLELIGKLDEAGKFCWYFQTRLATKNYQLYPNPQLFG